MLRTTNPSSTLVLSAQTSEELMTPNPVSLRADASATEAIALMTDRAISAAPVIDEAGRPVGVLSRSDLLIHERENLGRAPVPTGSDRSIHVGDIMTPAVFSVSTNTPAVDVVKRLSELRVHQLFVVDEHDALVGVISALDIVRQLVREVERQRE